MRLDPFHHPDSFLIFTPTLCSVKSELGGTTSGGGFKPIRSFKEILEGTPSPSLEERKWMRDRIPYEEFRILKSKWEQAQMCALWLEENFRTLSVTLNPDLCEEWNKERKRLDVLVKDLLPTWLHPWPYKFFVAYFRHGDCFRIDNRDPTSYLQEGLRVVMALKVFSDELPEHISQKDISLRGII